MAEDEIEDETKGNRRLEPVIAANKKRSHDDTATDNKDNGKIPNKLLKPSTTTIDPLTPTCDPCHASYPLHEHAKHKRNRGDQVMWVVYLAIQENAHGQFASALQRCQQVASTSKLDLRDKLQLVGTRHVTLWEGIMTRQQASRVGLDSDFEFATIPIGFQGWIPRGGYLELHAKSQSALKQLVQNELEGLPSTTSKSAIKCNHLSLYRARGMNWQFFNAACQEIRLAVPARDFGTVQGVSLRLKVVGSDYSHCRVLAGM